MMSLHSSFLYEITLIVLIPLIEILATKKMI